MAMYRKYDIIYFIFYATLVNGFRIKFQIPPRNFYLASAHTLGILLSY